MQNRILDLALKLCSIESLTGNEKAVCNYLEEFFLEKQFFVDKLFVDEKNGRFNLFIYKKKLSIYKTIFCTHLDTVSPYIFPKIEHEKLFARGACDAKGIAACMIFAFLEQINTNNQDIALLFTVGEETISDGAKYASKKLDAKCKLLVVGEPTELKFANYQMGTLAFELTSIGKKAHSALAHLGKSAVHTLISDCQKILSHDWPKNNWGENLINIGEIKGGIASNIVADYAIAKVLMRINTDPQILIDKIKQIISKDTTINILSLSSPFEYFFPKSEKIFSATFGSDAPYLKNIAEKIILSGPGSLTLAHTDEEHITFDELVNGFNHYMKIADLELD